MAELGDALTYGTGGEEDGVSVEMLDYDYIEKCTDPKLLRGIVKVLKSGREGLYPELTTAAEDKLISILPEKERLRILKMRQQATPDEIYSAENDVDNWVKEICSIDSRLKKEGHATVQEKPVRGQKREPNSSKPKASTKSSSSTASAPPKAPRLSGYDFRAWEKFDVDAAVAEVEEEEQASEAVSAQSREQNRAAAAKLSDEITAKRKDLFAREMNELLAKMEVGGMSQVQMELMAGREKTKGNECFRCGEHETAFHHYSRSIALDPTVPAYFTNRALVSIKLNKFETAEDDCTRALQVDAKIAKPWWLRGSARLHRGRCAEAILDYESALRVEPGNKAIEGMLAKALEQYEQAEGHPFIPGVPKSAASGAACLYETTDITSVQTWEELCVPSNLEVLSVGALRVDDGSAAEQKFTRIAIVDDSDEEEEEEEGTSPTRIAITCDDSEDEEEEETTGKKDEGAQDLPSGFTRIAIADSDSEEEEEGKTGPFDNSATLATIEQLKTNGNKLMQAGDCAGAINEYTNCLSVILNAGSALEKQNELKLAVLNNRSFAYLKMKDYRDAIADATGVLSAEPKNPKALYRRALAFEGFTDYKAAMADVEVLLTVDSANVMALELKGRLAAQLAPPPALAEQLPTSGDDEIRLDNVKQAAMKMLSNGDYEAAIKKLEAAVGKGGDPATATLEQLLMTAYRGLGQDQNVISCASNILSRDKGNFRATLCRSSAYLAVGDLESAKIDALAAMRVDGSNSEAMAVLDQVQQAEELKNIKEQKSSEKEAAPVDSAAESVRLKDAGNEALGKEKFDMAVALYTEAIKMDSGNMAALNNRAMAYLKANRFIDAERDATSLLEKEQQGGKTPNVKALYRRGVARKNIGGKVSLLGAQEDFNALLQIEPANKTAKSEKAKVEQLLSEMRYSSGVSTMETITSGRATTVSKSPEPASNQSSSSSSNPFGMTARSTTIKKKEATSPVHTSPEAPGATPAAVANPSPSAPATPVTAKLSASGAKISTPGSSGRKMKEPVVPTEPPRTLYELERTWRGLKIRPDLFARYVQTFTKATFKNVFKEAMTPDLLSSILSTIRNEIVVSSPETAQRLLRDMTNIVSFSMTMALLPADDLATLREIFSALQVHIGTGSADVAKLINTYGLTM